MRVFVSLLPLIALAYLGAVLAYLAPRKSGYSHLRHTISEIGEIGAPDQRLVAFGLFLPVGLAFALLGFFLRTNPFAASLACCIAAGYAAAAAFPCDPGSPVSGTARQVAHNLGGAIQYIGGGLSLLALSERLVPELRVAAYLVLGSAFLLTVMPSGGVRGLAQRVAEVALFGCASYVAWVV